MFFFLRSAFRVSDLGIRGQGLGIRVEGLRLFAQDCTGGHPRSHGDNQRNEFP